MRTIPRLLVGCAVALVPLLSATTLAQKVTYDDHSGDNFSRLRTYAFKSTPDAESATAHTTCDSPSMEERFKLAVAAQLERRGLTLDRDNPDVYVTLRCNLKTDYTVYSSAWGAHGWPTRWGYSWGDGPYFDYMWNRWPEYSTWYAEERVNGVLTIDLEDAATGALLWRGVGEKHVHESAKPARRAERANELVSEIMKKLPVTITATGAAREAP
jgi:hypothetical protein